jgi:hypothetical protein
MIERAEGRFILSLSRTAIGEDKRPLIEAAAKNSFDWEYILDRSAREGVHCLLYGNLREGPISIPRQSLG